MLLEEDLAYWLTETRGVSAPISFDALPDAEPHRAVAISISGGVEPRSEEIFDVPTVTVLTRGPNGKSARDLALEVDRAIMDQAPGFYLTEDGTRVVDRGRFGGPPAFVTNDDRARAVRACTYWLEVER